MNKEKITTNTLKSLDKIDKNHESGKITKEQHDKLSKKVVKQSFKEILGKR